MTPATLVAELRARGVTLRPDGKTLRVRPVSKVTPAELEHLRRHKTEVMKLLALALDPVAYAFPWPDVVPRLGGRSVGALTRCSRCARGTWVRYGATAMCLGCAKGSCDGAA